MTVKCCLALYYCPFINFVGNGWKITASIWDGYIQWISQNVFGVARSVKTTNSTWGQNTRVIHEFLSVLHDYKGKVSQEEGEGKA